MKYVKKLGKIFLGMILWDLLCSFSIRTLSGTDDFIIIKAILYAFIVLMIFEESGDKRIIAIASPIVIIIFSHLPVGNTIEGIELVIVIAILILSNKYLSSNSIKFPRLSSPVSSSYLWEDHDFFNPFFEHYYYDDINGLIIKNGLIIQTTVKIPLDSHSLVQHRKDNRLLGLSSLIFMDTFNGETYEIKNIRYKSLLKLLSLM